MTQLSLALLGPFQVQLNGQEVSNFRSAKTRALLAYLAVESERPHSREALAGLLWPDCPDRVARQNLRQTLYYLTQALPQEKGVGQRFVLRTRGAIQFNTQSDHWMDVSEFRGHLKEGRLEAAVALYQGDLLADMFVQDSNLFEEWLLLTREQLHRLAMDALGTLTQQALSQRDYQTAEKYAGRQLALEPWREEAHRQLMQILFLRGQRSAALVQYEKCGHVLAEEMGVAPDAQTTALYERIKGGSSETSLPGETSAEGKPAPHNLPVQATLFVGRERDLAHIQEQLAHPACRLLTLVGIGGIGKTRLAIQAASREVQHSRFSDGIYFVALAGITAVPADLAGDETRQTIAAAIATALNLVLNETSPPFAQLLDYLRGKQMLLVLDNLEHLLEETTLISEMIATAPGVEVLATSREPLALQGEYVYTLEGLEIPPAGSDDRIEAYDSVRLFVQYARRVQPRFTLDKTRRAAIAQICRHVGGIPLAIELAASWLRGLTCAEIVAEMDQLDFFTSPLRDISPRHRSIRGIFERSWRLLVPQQRDLLARLAVFSGGFQLAAAQSVAQASVLDLTTLVAKSLLRRQPSGRYTLHALLRQFAREKLAERPELEARALSAHSSYYLAYVQEREKSLQGQAGPAQAGRQQQALAELESEVDNIRQAWQWATREGAEQQELRLEAIRGALLGLFLFYERQRWCAEGELAIEQAASWLERTTGPTPLLGQTKALQALCAASATSRQHARDLLERAQSLLAGEEIPPAALLALGSTATLLQEYTKAGRLLEQAMAGTPAIWVQARAYYLLGLIDNKRGAFAQAWPKIQTSLSLQRQLDDPPGLAVVLSTLGYVGAFLGHVEMVDYLLESLELQRALSDKWGMATALDYLGTAMVHRGDYNQAEQYYRQSLQLGRQVGNPRCICNSLANLSLMLIGQARYQEIVQLSSEGLSLGTAGRDKESLFLGALGYAELKLGLEEKLAQSHLQAALDLAQEIHFPLATIIPLCGLGELAWRQESYQTAWTRFQQALSAAHKIGATFFALGALLWLARLRAQMGATEQALEWLSLVRQHPVTSPAERRIAESSWEEIAAGIPEDVVAAAETRGNSQDLARMLSSVLHLEFR